MGSSFRFGRRVPLPSTRQIQHDLRMLMAADAIKALERELRDATAAPGAGARVLAPRPDS